MSTNDQQVLILSGLPASGKTAEAEAWVKADENKRVRINYDDLRRELPGPWSRDKEDQVKKNARDMFTNAVKLGMSVVIDNTNLTDHAKISWANLAKEHGLRATVRPVGSFTPVWDLIERDRKRDKRVGRAVIERMALFNNHLKWEDKEQYNYEGFVICDLDGTLADLGERRKHMEGEKKDWKSFFADVDKDKLNAPVAELLDMFADDGYGILLVSGRPIDPCGIPTEDWLTRHRIRYDHLFMREGFDHRPDTVIKKEILAKLPKDRIDYVLDDRQSVVDMWRAEGLFCMQVAEGSF